VHVIRPAQPGPSESKSLGFHNHIKPNQNIFSQTKQNG
jgi:hypothetical protein